MAFRWMTEPAQASITVKLATANFTSAEISREARKFGKEEFLLWLWFLFSRRQVMGITEIQKKVLE